MSRVTVLAEEGPISFEFDDLVRYHGHAALAMLAITFRAQEVAFRRLRGSAPAPRTAISVTSGHPGPGVRDAFEMITRCVTRGTYLVDSSIPGPRLNAATNVVYAFTVTVSGAGTQHLAVRDGVLPPEFFRLLNASPAEADSRRFAALKREIAGEVVATPDPEDLFIL